MIIIGIAIKRYVDVMKLFLFFIDSSFIFTLKMKILVVPFDFEVAFIRFLPIFVEIVFETFR
jgi:hypothetical protein